MSRPRGKIEFSLHELGPRSGDSYMWHKKIVLPDSIGTTDLSVPAGAQLDLELLGFSCEDGVSLSVKGKVQAEGHCMRCLEDFTQEFQLEHSRVYYHADRYETLVEEAGKDFFSEEVDLDPEFQLLDNSTLDLEPLLIDALVPQIPYLVVCREDCEGLCPDCGVLLAEVEEDHYHDDIDPRLSALANLFSSQLADQPSQGAGGNDLDLVKQTLKTNSQAEKPGERGE